ncbi:hypothetical protein V6N12_003196 [Hibiscus sabdariffa]|uniref:Uncharacterized protein n=1 Tax=Hibiscus sabdariffa TaxID=183260 RepID=A0ABR2EB70_9ROSI
MRKVTGKRKETDENEEIKAAFNVTLKKETVPEFSYSATVTRGHEAIVPCDLNLITDMDLRYLIQKPDEKVSFAILSDSCHSGGLINKDKEQIGPSRVRSRAPPPQVHFKSRGILVGTIWASPKDCSFKDCSALLMDDGGVDFSFATVVDCNGIKLIGAVKT